MVAAAVSAAGSLAVTTFLPLEFFFCVPAAPKATCKTTFVYPPTTGVCFTGKFAHTATFTIVSRTTCYVCQQIFDFHRFAYKHFDSHSSTLLPAILERQHFSYLTKTLEFTPAWATESYFSSYDSFHMHKLLTWQECSPDLIVSAQLISHSISLFNGKFFKSKKRFMRKNL